MSTQHNLTYYDGYDDEAHDRYIEYEIVYSFSPGYMDSVDTTGIRDFRVDAEIYIDSVQVRYIEIYEPISGQMIARVKREDIGRAALAALDEQATRRVDTDISCGGPLSKQLADAENAE